MTRSRIICVGNRYCDRDAVGPRVHDALRSRRLPAGVDLVDGGLGGLRLLGLVEGMGRIVFVDALEGFAAPGEVTFGDITVTPITVTAIAPTAAIPEPMSAIFFATGALGLVGFVKRRRMRKR